MSELISVPAIVDLHRKSIELWKVHGVEYRAIDFLRGVEENHAFNFQLWAVEDEARRDDLGAEFVRAAKRKIDKYNQQRNDRMEWMDAAMHVLLKPAAPSDSPVHSETPGMMIDRLSILALKSYHMGLQVKRVDVDATHRKTCLAKCAVIDAQLRQLANCLTQLLHEVEQKTRTFCIYRQFKMYNDPGMQVNLNFDQPLSVI